MKLDEYKYSVLVEDKYAEKCLKRHSDYLDYSPERLKMISFNEYIVAERQGVALLDDIKAIASLYDRASILLSETIKNKRYIKVEDENIGPFASQAFYKYDCEFAINLNSLRLNCIKKLNNCKIEFKITDISSTNIDLNEYIETEYDETLQFGSYRHHENDIFVFDTIVKNSNTIIISLTTIRGKINKYIFFDLIFHEFNHFFQDIFQTIKDGRSNNTEQMKIDGDLKIINHYRELAFSTSNASYNLLYNIFYFILSNSEFNAFLAGAFGELCSKSIKLSDLKNEIENTDAFRFYDKIKTKVLRYIDFLEDKDLNELKETIIKTSYKRYGLYEIAEHGTNNLLKTQLKKCVGFRLKKYDKKFRQITDTFAVELAKR